LHVARIVLLADAVDENVPIVNLVDPMYGIPTVLTLLRHLIYPFYVEDESPILVPKIDLVVEEITDDQEALVRRDHFVIGSTEAPVKMTSRDDHQ